MRHSYIWLIWLPISCLSPLLCHAQADAGALQRGLEQQMPSPSPLELPSPVMPNAAPQKPKIQQGTSFLLKSFVLEGVKLLTEEQVLQTLNPWVGRTVGFDDLQEACDAIVNLYREHGLVVQAILPPQKIINGIVKILITEAKLSRVIVDTPQGKTRFSPDLASDYITHANPIGKPLNVKSIEESIIILNETPGVIAISTLEAGEEIGETAVRLQLTDGNLVQGKVEVNNYGSRTTGANQGIISLGLNNPLGYGDQASLNGVASEGSQYLQGAYSFPGSKDGLRLGISGTYLQYKNVSNYGVVNTANASYGDAWTTGVSAAYPLVRKTITNVNLSANYDLKSYTNNSAAKSIPLSSYNIRDFSLGLAADHIDDFLYGGVSNASATLIFGNLEILSTSLVGYGAQTPNTFGKLAFSGSHNRRLVEDGAYSLFLSASGQLSTANLNSAEQFYLGGPYGVRSYPVAQAGGAQGGLASVELRKEFLQDILGFIFFDAGIVQQYISPYYGWQGPTNASNIYTLMGTGLGIKLKYERWNLSATIAWKVGNNPLYNQSGLPVNTDGTTTNPRGWLSGSYQF